MASYYSPDSILADAHKVPCTFELAVPQLAAINNGVPVKKGDKMELPLWLAEILAVSRADGVSTLLSLEIPTALGPRVLNALRADPKSVDVREHGQNFYALGARILDLFDDEEIAEVLNDTFKQRTLELADKSQNHRTAHQATEFTRGLDEDERKILNDAYNAKKSVDRWFDNAGRS